MEQKETVHGATCLLILGMHRSGTSSVAGQLSHLGLHLGNNLLENQPANPKGHFESRDIIALHEELLRTLGASWADPRSLPAGWLHNPSIAPYRARLASLIHENFAGKQLFGVKDPRLCRLAPLWLDLLAELNIGAKILLVARNPAEVVLSLESRNSVGPEHAAMLWLSHVLSAERCSRGVPRALVLYEDWLSDWPGEFARLDRELALAMPACDPARNSNDFVEPALRRQQTREAPVLHAPQNAWLEPVWNAMLAWRRDETSPAAICDAAASAVAEAEAGAEPIAAYFMLLAERDKAARGRKRGSVSRLLTSASRRLAIRR